MNTFLWFFEARKDPQNAPLAIWLNGGPGASSILGLLVENGPCSVNPDSNSTCLNPWSWNNAVNMLYLDQPTQAGYNYDTLRNISYNLNTGNVSKLSGKTPEQNSTFLCGTYPSGNPNRTSHGTEDAARAAWHFMQIWLQEFPEYHPNNSKVSLTVESHGGRYGPAFAAYFQEQNDKIKNGSLPLESKIIDLDTLLIVNGCIDRLVQMPSYPKMAYGSTYGIRAIHETIAKNMTFSFERKGGCRDKILRCREVAATRDPENLGRNATVNKICKSAETFCRTYIVGPYRKLSGRNYYDIATLEPDPFPPPFKAGYLNQAHVQSALSVPLNWTSTSDAVSKVFPAIGDYSRDGLLQDLQYLLASGIKVALVYGDRDFACNWYGGEAASLTLNHTGFEEAGYSGIRTNATYEGGLVRQHGNLSFSRVFEASHEVPAYQPETACRIFMRALFGLDIATGSFKVDGRYSTQGPGNVDDVKSAGIEQPLQFCYLLDYKKCTKDQFKRLRTGRQK